MSLCLYGISPRQDKHNRYMRLACLNLLPSTLFLITWVAQSGVPSMDSKDYTILYATRKTGKWSASAGVCSRTVELMGGALMVWRATTAWNRNRYLRPIPSATYAFFFGICIASLVRQTQTIELVGKAVSNIQGPAPGSCTSAPSPNITCKTLSEYWFSIQEPMTGFDVSEYRDQAQRICDKELQHSSSIQSGSLENIAERRHLLDSDNFLLDCASPSREELTSLQLAFGSQLIEPIQTTYRWWQRARALGSFSLGLVCKSLIGARVIIARRPSGPLIENCAHCKPLMGQKLAIWTAASLDSGLPFTLVGIAGIYLKSSISSPGPVGSLEYGAWLHTNNVKHVIHVLWIHTQAFYFYDGSNPFTSPQWQSKHLSLRIEALPPTIWQALMARVMGDHWAADVARRLPAGAFRARLSSAGTSLVPLD
ncbi:hypothetical protein BKA70DRAFT_1229204 [Coprinopsis sp. MPI-PUGE-AT-0042]|nr:hypothetical protein BKA70DRAFT_1229204 [Coprinopsis sp. MPI-PUGE-AT-0042]